MAEAALEIRGLERSFKSFALGPIDITVPRGSIYALIGPNGAGKTTTFDLIFGIGAKAAGSITVLGLDHIEDEVAMKRQVAYVSPDLNFKSWMRVKSLIRFVRSFHPTWDDEYCARLLETFDLSLSTRWRAIALMWLLFAVQGVMSAFVSGPAIDRGIAWLSADLMRLVLTSIPVLGIFFMEREVVTLPVSLQDMWRAKWLLATVGVTVLSASGWGASAIVFGDGASDVLWLTTIEFLSAGTCAACEVFLLRTPDLVAKQRGVFRWVAGLTWVGMPAWCYYARAYAPRNGAAPTLVFAGLTAALAAMTYVGFRALPAAHMARLPLGANGWTSEPGDEQRKSESASRLTIRRPRNGVVRWVRREVAWAVAYGIGGVLLIAPIEIWMPVGERGPTLLEALSGIFRPDHPFGMAFYAALPLAWLSRLTPNLRLFRSVPISLWTLVSVLTVGPVVGWTSVWCLQMGAHRWSFGAWPSSPPFSVFFFVLSLSAAAKTVLLTLGSRYSILGVVVVINVAIVGLPTTWTTDGMAIVPAAASSISLVVLLMFADHMILTRTSRLYRPSTSIV